MSVDDTFADTHADTDTGPDATLRRRIAEIDPAVFDTALRGFPVLMEAARRHRHAGPTPDTMRQINLVIDAACSNTADGRWLIARMLITSYLHLLRRQGLSRRRDIETYTIELARCLPSLPAQVMARYEQSMSGALEFLCAFHNKDSARQQELIRRQHDLLYTLTGLVATLCAAMRS